MDGFIDDDNHITAKQKWSKLQGFGEPRGCPSQSNDALKWSDKKLLDTYYLKRSTVHDLHIVVFV